MSIRQVELLAIHTSRDAYVREGQSCYLVRPPLFRQKYPVDESDVDRAVKSGEFEPPDQNRKSFVDTASLVAYLSEPLPKADSRTVQAALEFVSKCSPKWRERLFLQHDRGDPELVEPLLIGVRRLEDMRNLTEDEERRLAKWRAELEDIQKKREAKLYSSDAVPTPPRQDDAVDISPEIEVSGDIFSLDKEAQT